MRLGDWSISAVAAEFLAVLVSYSGPLVIFYQAAQASNMSNDMLASWVWVISIGAGISNGLFYLVGGLFGGTLVLLFAALPKELAAVLAGRHYWAPSW